MYVKDWKVLEGLRGLLALMILLEHTAVNVWMKMCVSQFPSTAFFIVLSGFSLGRTYALRSWNIYSILTFYRKRLTRILPSYLLNRGLWVLVLYPIETAVYKEINMSLFYKEITLLFSSWYPQYIYPCPIFKDIGATWFISTILFCYMVFPIFMMMTQKCTTTKKVFIAIAILFWIQNMIALFTAIWMNERNKLNTTTSKDSIRDECYSNMFILFRNFPPLRLWGFFMGVLGGVYVWKVENGEIDYGNDGSSVLQLVFTIFPVNSISCLRCFGTSNENEAKDRVKEQNAQRENKDEQNAWIKKVDFSMGICAFGATVLGTMAYFHKYYGWFRKFFMRFVVKRDSFIIFPYALNYCFVVSLIGLCQDRNRSFTSKILSVRFLRWIGKSSFHLYVIQFPIIKFLNLVIPQNLIPEEFEPVVMTIVVYFGPILGAYVMRKIYDEPIQSLCK